MKTELPFEELLVALAGFSSDPLGFVYFAFPWGEKGSELEHMSGPEPWQIKLLSDLGNGVLTLTEAIQLARTSGHGVGKSACVSWIILWAISTFEDTKGVVTANTETQLKTKTWAELAKWYRLCIARPLFSMTATGLFSADPDHEKTWRIDMVPWSVKNTEAFAGLHNQGKRIIVIFDEASAIDDLIWEVTEGALTDKDTQIIWLAFGNPTRNKGRFRDCFTGGKFAHRWLSDRVDSREVSFTNKVQISRWIEDYGEDHDFVRVRVRGVFPRVDAVSFISFEIATAATTRPLPESNPERVILGVDVGRFGTDPTVIIPRQGRDARSRPMEILRGWDLMRQAARIVQLVNLYNAVAVMVDVGGVGGGLVDRLRQLGVTVYEVDFGSSPDGYNLEDAGTKYYNKRAEIWGGLAAWLPHGCISNEIAGQDETLVDELTAPTYTYAGDDMEIQLEKKKDMLRRGVPSPNAADALACTFAFPIYLPAISLDGLPPKPYVAEDYNPFAPERMNS